MAKWRIGDLTEREVEELILFGCDWLKDVTSNGDEDSTCIAFRAGDWCIQPVKATLSSLKANGIRIDSTMAPGLRHFLAGEWCDFRNVPDLPYWLVHSDLCAIADIGILEIPITTGRISRWRYLTAVPEARSSGMAVGCVGSYAGPNQSY